MVRTPTDPTLKAQSPDGRLTQKDISSIVKNIVPETSNKSFQESQAYIKSELPTSYKASKLLVSSTDN